MSLEVLISRAFYLTEMCVSLSGLKEKAEAFPFFSSYTLIPFQIIRLVLKLESDLDCAFTNCTLAFSLYAKCQGLTSISHRIQGPISRGSNTCLISTKANTNMQ